MTTLTDNILKLRSQERLVAYMSTGVVIPVCVCGAELSPGQQLCAECDSLLDCDYDNSDEARDNELSLKESIEEEVGHGC